MKYELFGCRMLLISLAHRTAAHTEDGVPSFKVHICLISGIQITLERVDNGCCTNLPPGSHKSAGVGLRCSDQRHLTRKDHGNVVPLAHFPRLSRGQGKKRATFPCTYYAYSAKSISVRDGSVTKRQGARRYKDIVSKSAYMI